MKTRAKGDTSTHKTNWKFRGILAGFLVIAVALVWLLAATVVPREWAQWVGNRTNGGTFAGLGLGLTIGFVFTLLPIAVIRQTLREIPWGARLSLAVVALALAVPNLMTLGIVVGNGSAAHAGERILDVEGTGFRAGSATGAAIAAVIGIGWFVFTAIRNRSVR